MAVSNSHKLGQIIGDILELALGPHLAVFAKKHHLYLDRKGPRPCRPNAKVSWSDINGSTHDLDFVLERGGTPDRRGVPVAFIETAWRSYTKHSRAKAQEIQGAIEPLVEKHRQSSPFKGVVLAGVFTKGAVSQLRSLGYHIVHIPHSNVVRAFATESVDVSFDEDTPERTLKQKVSACTKLSQTQRQKIGAAMLRSRAEDLASFLSSLAAVARRKVILVRLLALYGGEMEFPSVAEALSALSAISRESSSAPFKRYEIRIQFSNGDRVEGNFESQADATAFLKLAGE